MSQGNQRRTRYWYKISLDAIRGWTTFLVVLVLVVAGIVGYRLLERHLLDRQAVVAMEEAAEYAERLREEDGLDLHRDKYDNARENLAEARTYYDEGSLAKALVSAERSRTLLAQISDALLHRNPAGEAQIISSQGNVEVRRGERSEWRPARNRMFVYAGDYLKTAANSSTEVMMTDGTLFTVRPGTVVLVRRSRAVAGMRSERTLELESGWVNLSTSGAGSRVKTPRAEARVEERSEAVVAYDQGTSEGRFAAYRGEMNVASSDGATRKLGELQQVVQRGDQLSLPQSIPEAPVVLAPEDNIEVTLGDPDPLVLRWRSVKGAATYALQVSHNRLFVDNIIDVDERAKTLATLGLKREGTYVWRVAAFDREGEKGPWSPAHRFRVALPVGEVRASGS